MRARCLGLGLTLAVLLGASVAAFAQTVPGNMTIGWKLPTTGCTVGVTPCDNIALGTLGALTAVQVYLSTAPIPDNFTGAPTLTLSGTATTTQHTMNVPNGATLYARLKAVNGAGPSPFSVQVSKKVEAPVAPGVPTEVTITLAIG